MVNPTILNHPMQPKQTDVPALFTQNEDGLAHIVSDCINQTIMKQRAFSRLSLTLHILYMTLVILTISRLYR